MKSEVQLFFSYHRLSPENVYETGTTHKPLQEPWTGAPKFIACFSRIFSVCILQYADPNFVDPGSASSWYIKERSMTGGGMWLQLLSIYLPPPRTPKQWNLRRGS
jgi:hypothetical protein